MKTITLQGLDFEPYITKQEIAAQVKRVAAEINDDLDGEARNLSDIYILSKDKDADDLNLSM